MVEWRIDTGDSGMFVAIKLVARTSEWERGLSSEDNMTAQKLASKEKHLRALGRWSIALVYLALFGLTLAMSAALTLIQARY
jgi:hypothetical protein